MPKIKQTATIGPLIR